MAGRMKSRFPVIVATLSLKKLMAILQYINTRILATKAISKDRQDNLSLVDLSFPRYEKKNSIELVADCY